MKKFLFKAILLTLSLNSQAVKVVVENYIPKGEATVQNVQLHFLTAGLQHTIDSPLPKGSKQEIDLENFADQLKREHRILLMMDVLLDDQEDLLFAFLTTDELTNNNDTIFIKLRSIRLANVITYNIANEVKDLKGLLNPKEIRLRKRSEN